VYSQTLAGSGGTTPYAWSATGLPPGLGLDPASGILSGTPTDTGAFSILFTLADKSAPPQTVTQAVTLTIAPPILSIITLSLPDGTVGSTYSQIVAASGGTSPYHWSATGLPSGLGLNPATGAFEGAAASAGTASLVVTVTDSSTPPQSVSATLSLRIAAPMAPNVQITPTLAQVTSIANTPSVAVSLASVAPAPLTATLTLSFTPNAAGLPSGGYAYKTPAFPTGPTAIITIPQASMTGATPAMIVPGSVAGSITVTLTSLTGMVNGQAVDLTLPTPNPSTTIVVPRMAPEILSVAITPATGGFTVDINASSTPRDLISASVIFQTAEGASLSDASYPNIPLTSQSNAWFNSQAGQTSGGAFSLQIPFTYSGDLTAVQSVAVTLTNSAGTSVSKTNH